jgi:hypothetical protein
MKIPFGLAEITKLDIEHCALLSIILGFHKNNKPLFMLNKPLAKITGMSESKVRQKLKNLQIAGWIDIQLNVKNDYYFYDRLITFKKDVNLLEQQLEALESKLLTFDVNSDVDILLDHPIENHTPIKNSMVKTADYPIENVTPSLTKSIDPPIENDIHIRLIDNDNKLVLDNKNNSCKIQILQEQELNIISKQNDFITQYPEVIDLLDVSMIEVFNENKYTIDEFCKSKDFELIKKEYRMVKRNLPAPKPKNRETLTNWYLSLGKVQVADNLYMYPYQAIILKLVFNHKYLAKMINHYDSTWFSRDNKFKEFTDHYANIVSWLKTDIEKNILKQGNNQFDRYYYYNWGVDRNEIL